jgi:hypothetical protein
MNRMHLWITALVLLSLPISQVESNDRFAEVDENFYFIWTHDDMRMCPAPECGGFYVKALNRLQTLCTDGSQAADCQVLQLDFSLLDMDEKEQADFQQTFTDGLGIIKGKLFQAQQNGILLPALLISEAWLAQIGKEPRRGGFFRVHDTGIQCITNPCLSVDESLLNQPMDRVIAGVDLSTSGAETDQINAGYLEMKTGYVITTGRHKIIHGPAGFAQVLDVSEFYLPAVIVQTCGKTVCPAGQTCCNASCGICTPPGGVCVQMFCD